MSNNSDQLVRKLVVVGHVDHGKSTLLGRIMMELNLVAEDKLNKVESVCSSKSIDLEPAYLLDALEEEQARNVTIDTTRMNFEFHGIRYLLIDVPGHLEFLRNMTSGASDADLGILVIDWLEGIREQSRQHLRVLAVLGVTDVVVAVNKVDCSLYSENKHKSICEEVQSLIEREHLRCADVVPISALHGDNVLLPGRLAWYQGRTLLGVLSELASKAPDEQDICPEPFRMILQDVYQFDGQRSLVGRITSGRIQPGADLLFSPSGRIATVEAIVKHPDHSVLAAQSGDSIALKLTEAIDVERGELISNPEHAPQIDTEFRARLVWLSSGEQSLDREYLLKLGTAECQCAIQLVDQEGEPLAGDGACRLSNGAITSVLVKLSKPLSFDTLDIRTGLNKFVLCTEDETVAAGRIDSCPVRPPIGLLVNPNIRSELGYIERSARQQRQGHSGAVVWLTGLSGAGKTTLAKSLEERLFRRNYQVVALDADNLRSRLCADLGFSAGDRSENIRRIAHVARLFLDIGYIVVVACIAPYRHDRETARHIVGARDFNEVFLFCPISVCQQRDPKSLYRKALSGEVQSVTGVDAPYQPPARPELRLDSSVLTIEEEVGAVLKLLSDKEVVDLKEFEQ